MRNFWDVFHKFNKTLNHFDIFGRNQEKEDHNAQHNPCPKMLRDPNDVFSDEIKRCEECGKLKAGSCIMNGQYVVDEPWNQLLGCWHIVFCFRVYFHYAQLIILDLEISKLKQLFWQNLMTKKMFEYLRKVY